MPVDNLVSAKESNDNCNLLNNISFIAFFDFSQLVLCRSFFFFHDVSSVTCRVWRHKQQHTLLGELSIWLSITRGQSLPLTWYLTGSSRTTSLLWWLLVIDRSVRWKASSINAQWKLVKAWTGFLLSLYHTLFFPPPHKRKKRSGYARLQSFPYGWRVWFFERSNPPLIP